MQITLCGCRITKLGGDGDKFSDNLYVDFANVPRISKTTTQNSPDLTPKSLSLRITLYDSFPSIGKKGGDCGEESLRARREAAIEIAHLWIEYSNS